MSKGAVFGLSLARIKEMQREVDSALTGQDDPDKIEEAKRKISRDYIMGVLKRIGWI